jgi:4-hydroxyphenylpyruvate dioxygenase-like putative hemolysin
LFTLWGNGQVDITANVAAQAHAQIGDNISSIFTDGVNFIAALAAEVLRQMGNSTP